jgi:exodeoxyribonuclease VII small subunit
MSDANGPAAAEASAGEVQELGFDELIADLRRVVDRLESGNLSLEDSLRDYERGVALARRGHSLLDAAEKRVELLVRSSGGQLVTEPLDPDAGDDRGDD